MAAARTTLAERNAHPRDALIHVNRRAHQGEADGSAAHYVIASGRATRVTELVDRYFSFFDPPAVAARMLERCDFLEAPRYARYHAMDLWMPRDPDHTGPPVLRDDAVDRIVAAWRSESAAASEAGTRMHAGCERYVEGVPLDDVTLASPEHALFLRFYAKAIADGWRPYRTEWRVFDDDANVAGTMDLVMRHVDDVGVPRRLWVVDYKRTKLLEWRARYQPERARPPLQRYQACNGVAYSLQLHLYAAILERNYGVGVARTTIVVLHPSQAEPIVIDAADMRDAARTVLDVCGAERDAAAFDDDEEQEATGGGHFADAYDAAHAGGR